MPVLSSSVGAIRGAQNIIDNSKKDRKWLIVGALGAWVAAILAIFELFFTK